MKFDKESPACLASTLNIQTVLAGVVSPFSCIVDPYSLQMMSRDHPPREMSSKRRKLFRLNGHFALCLLRVYCHVRPTAFQWAVRGHRNRCNYTECWRTVVQTKADSIDLHCLLLFCSSARLYAVGVIGARLRLSVRPYLFSYPDITQMSNTLFFSELARLSVGTAVFVCLLIRNTATCFGRIVCLLIGNNYMFRKQCLFVCLLIRNTATCFGSLICRFQADIIYIHEKVV